MEPLCDSHRGSSVTVYVAGENGGTAIKGTTITIPIGTVGYYDDPDGHGFYFHVISWD